MIANRARCNIAGGDVLRGCLGYSCTANTFVIITNISYIFYVHTLGDLRTGHVTILLVGVYLGGSLDILVMSIYLLLLYIYVIYCMYTYNMTVGDLRTGRVAKLLVEMYLEGILDILELLYCVLCVFHLPLPPRVYICMYV